MSRIALAAAGTGGHVFPALAVAHELVRRGADHADVVFFGGDRLEARVVPAAGFELVPLPLQGLERRLTARNLRIPGRLLAAVRTTRAELERRGTRALLATGGYVAVPTALAARRAGVPYFLQEQNAAPGLANRVMARRAAEVFAAFPAAAERLGGRLTGNPLRRELVEFDRASLAGPARRRYDIPEGVPVLGVAGGSLGAQTINQAVAELVRSWDGSPLAVVHLAGAAHAERLAGPAAEAPVPWRVLPFEPEMHYFYAVADLVVSRSSGVSTSELAATGSPALLVPRSVTRAGHYVENAAYLVDAGAAEVLPEDELATLPARVGALLGDRERLAGMAAAATRQGLPGAATEIADALLEAARG